MKSGVYIVVGTCGLDREDREWWIVRGFASKRDAETIAAGATDEAARLYDRWNERLREWYEDDSGRIPKPKRKPRPRFDPDMWSMAGVQTPTYHVEEVAFIREGEA